MYYFLTLNCLLTLGTEVTTTNVSHIYCRLVDFPTELTSVYIIVVLKFIVKLRKKLS